MKKIIAWIILSISIGVSFNVNSKNVPIPKIKPNYHYLKSEQKLEVLCLATVMYFEALNDSETGQLAVAMTTINRTKSEYFPNSICLVAKEKRRNTCQYSWYCDSRKKRFFYDRNLLDNDAPIEYNDMLKLATYIYLNYDYISDPSKSALFFHRNNINPKWKNMKHTASIGKHVYYTRRNLPNI